MPRATMHGTSFEYECQNDEGEEMLSILENTYYHDELTFDLQDLRELYYFLIGNFTMTQLTGIKNAQERKLTSDAPNKT